MTIGCSIRRCTLCVTFMAGEPSYGFFPVCHPGLGPLRREIRFIEEILYGKVSWYTVLSHIPPPLSWVCGGFSSSPLALPLNGSWPPPSGLLSACLYDSACVPPPGERRPPAGGMRRPVWWATAASSAWSTSIRVPFQKQGGGSRTTWRRVRLPSRALHVSGRMAALPTGPSGRLRRTAVGPKGSRIGRMKPGRAYPRAPAPTPALSGAFCPRHGPLRAALT